MKIETSGIITNISQELEKSRKTINDILFAGYINIIATSLISESNFDYIEEIDLTTVILNVRQTITYRICEAFLQRLH